MRFADMVITLVVATGAAAASDQDDIWRVAKTPDSRGFSLTYGDHTSGMPAYLFQCVDPDKILIVQYATAPLMDFNTGKNVADDTSDTLHEGVAFMRLATNVAQTNFKPATGVRSRFGRGWDIAIVVDRDDPIIAGLPSADRISLMTTGYTMAVAIEPEDRIKIRQFVDRCGTIIPPRKRIVSKKENPGVTRAGVKSVSYGG